MKKTIAEKIAEMKSNEAKAYIRYQDAVVNEVNACLKRLGEEEVNYDQILEAYQFTIDNCDEGKNTFNKCSIPVLTAVVRYVNELPYIRKACEKWSSLYRQLQKVKDLL